MVERFDINFTGLSHGDVIFALLDFADRCERHPAFLDGAPACVPGPPLYRELAHDLSATVSAGIIDQGSLAEIARLRNKGQRCMTLTGNYIVIFSDHHNDPGMLHSLGLKLKKRVYRKPTQPPLPVVKKYSVTDLAEPGTVLVKVPNRPRNGSIQVQVSEGGPLEEGSWRRIGNFYTCRFEVKGLDPVKRYHFRIRFESAAGTGPWSQVLTVVVS